ncbi:MAG: PH domain-containing protein [Candidatus Hodarchaeales archaeon]|jgi:membrane protein YdbS with pleckstrin-like domain
MEPIKIIGETGQYPEPKPWLFKPVRAFRIKLFVYYLLFLLFAFCIAFIINIARTLWFDLIGQNIFMFFLTFISIITLFFTIITVIVIHLYVNNFEYQVHGTEIIIKKGLVNITENHVPFSNITNISLRRGPLDQIFNIGSIIIHTAGEKRGTNTKIKMDGIYVFKEVGYYILKEIKNVESFLNTITLETPKKGELFPNEFWNQFLEEAKDMKSILEK